MRLVRAVIAGLCALLSTTALAGGRLPCPEARVFEGAAVSLLVLPYRYTGGRFEEEAAAGSRLAALIQQESLFAMLKYGSVGATELVWKAGFDCTPPAVMNRVLGSSGPGKVRPGHALIVVWGRIYEEGDELYVQTYLRFLRRDRSESIDVTVPGTGVQPLVLTAGLPAQAVAFVPRRLTRKDLAEIEIRAREALVLREAPSFTSKSMGPLAPSPMEPLAYGVIDARDGWMLVRSFITGTQGWVPARWESPAWSLRRFMPELAYLDAVAGYLRLRAQDVAPPTSNPQAQFDAVRGGLAAYERAIGNDVAPEAAGLARAMTATLLWTVPGLQLRDVSEEKQPQVAQRPPRRAAAQLFEDARKVLPESPGTRVLAAVTSPYLTAEPLAGAPAFAKINEGLVDALAVGATFSAALNNLERLYTHLARVPGASPYGQPELTRRLEIVRGALK